MSLTPPSYATETEAEQAPPSRDVSQACDTSRHRACVIARGPRQIEHGPRAGRWQPPFVCACPCHIEVTPTNGRDIP